MNRQAAIRRVPVQALIVSALALAVPLAARLLDMDIAEEHQSLLWLLALVPAFLLAYYRGWGGAATGVVAAMAVFAVAHAVFVGLGRGMGTVERAPEILAILVSVSVGIGWLSEKFHRDSARIRELALTDPLTDLPNRRYLELFLKAQFAAGVRGRDVSILIFDLDHFKEFNDEFGHPAGDRALIAVSEIFHALTRDMDLTARWGGEEFLSVLTDCTPDRATIFADRVRAEMAALDLDAPLTASVGIAQVRRGMTTASDAIAAADRALYRAKAQGRDQVCVEEEVLASITP